MATNVTDTSREAYAAIEPHLSTLQKRVYDIIDLSDYGLAPFEVIEEMRRFVTSEERSYSNYTIRPRITELKQLGMIIDNGTRRKNHRGRTEVVYTTTTVSAE